jgi:hypothetical protein
MDLPGEPDSDAAAWTVRHFSNSNKEFEMQLKRSGLPA